MNHLDVDGAILFRCGDSRNGGMYKALKKHYGWLPYCRIKTVGLAGGPHSPRTDRRAREILLEEVDWYCAALKRVGATNIALLIAEHEDCGCVALKGAKNIEQRWMGAKYLQTLFEKNPTLICVNLMHVGYERLDVSTVPSGQVVLTSIKLVEREGQSKLLSRAA